MRKFQKMAFRAILVALTAAMGIGIGNAQSCGTDSIYRIPYKNTYVKEALVAENDFHRVAQEF